MPNTHLLSAMDARLPLIKNMMPSYIKIVGGVAARMERRLVFFRGGKND
jgi:hypothetical protein